MKRMLIVVLACLLPTLVAAHDASSLNIIGFSDDDKSFAYEEYSGKDLDTYAIIHVIDIATGKEVQGAPAVSEADANDRDEKRAGMSLQMVRREVWEKAKPLLTGFNVPNNPAILFAASPYTQRNLRPQETSSGDQVLRFCESLLCSQGYQIELRLKTHKVKPHEFCSETNVQGLRLIAARYPDDDQWTTPKVIWNSSLGQSERCVYEYRLEQVVGNEDGLFVAMIAYWYPVVEGPHKRYLAVPIKLE